MLALLLETPADAATLIEGVDLTRHLVLCGALIAAIAALGFGFRKLLSGAVRARAARRSLEVLDVLPLGGKQRLSVVRCYDRTFVLGLGDKEMALLAEIDRDAAVLRPAPRPGAPEAPLAKGAPQARGAPDFASLLRAATGSARGEKAELRPARAEKREGLFA